jgi:hypothetical protein
MKNDTNALKMMRDELNLKMHLAKMEVRDEWQKLEPQVQHVLSNVAIVSGEAMADLHKRMLELKSRLS